MTQWGNLYSMNPTLTDGQPHSSHTRTWTHTAHRAAGIPNIYGY